MSACRSFILVASSLFAALAFAADDVAINPVYAALKGRWEGTLNGEFRSQDVSWHFEIDDAGELKGYIGPSKGGMPSLPMENLVISDGQVSFTIEAQHGAFQGTISPDGIGGTWQQGMALPLQMKKKNFVFALSDGVRADLVGAWDRADDGYTIHLEFTEADNGMLSGALTIPRSDLDEIPLVDIFVTDEGHAQFATDNGRRFTGRLINGVLLGEYANNGTNSRITFVHPGQEERGFDLDLGAAALEKLAGRWYTRIFWDDLILEYYRTEDGKIRGQLLSEEGKRTVDPLLEADLQGDAVSFTAFSGKTFNGTLAPEGIVGEYRANNRPFRMTFTREPK